MTAGIGVVEPGPKATAFGLGGRFLAVDHLSVDERHRLVEHFRLGNAPTLKDRAIFPIT